MGWLGGGGAKPYQSSNLPDYEQAAKSGLFNRAGITRQRNPDYDRAMADYERQMQAYNTSQAAPQWGERQAGFNSSGAQWNRGGFGPQMPQRPTGIDEYSYDFSNFGKPTTGSFNGNTYNAGNQSYDFSAINEALQGYRNPTQLTQTYQSGYTPQAYNPYQFNFSSLPKEYGDIAYQTGSRDINKQGQDALEKTREAVGVRRPGLLLKAAEQNQRDVGEQLANLNAQIRLQEMMKATDLGVDQQKAQAAENFGAAQFGEGQRQFQAGEGYRGYQSRADLEKNNSDNRFRNLQALNEAGINSVATQSNLLQNERADRDKALEWLIQLLGQSSGAQNQAASISQAGRGQTLGLLGQGLSAASSLFCLPVDTEIETEEGSIPVQDVHVGDEVKGGRVIATVRHQRTPDHQFYEHKFDSGTVVMSDGHPYFDRLISRAIVPSESDSTYDILTDSGFYYVNGVKLGSTIKDKGFI